jgi:hypothetical protein
MGVDTAQLTIEPFVGHRVWRVVPGLQGPTLAALTNGDPWTPGDQRAECHAGVLLVPRERRESPGVHPDEAIPDVACTCGIYASRVPQTPPHRRVWARGLVRLWGRVIEGEKGYRASRARVEGDVEILLGMGPGRARCTNPTCREVASRIWTGSKSYLARCSPHARGRTASIDEFMDSVDRSFRIAYGAGARLAGT